MPRWCLGSSLRRCVVAASIDVANLRRHLRLRPGGLVATDNEDDDETMLKRLATPLTATLSIILTRTRTRGEDGGADGDDDNKALGGDDDLRHPKQRHTAVVSSPHPAPSCASMLGMSPMRQEKEEERTMEREEDAGKMVGVQK